MPFTEGLLIVCLYLYALKCGLELGRALARRENCS